jgi:hypothetical protein
MTDPELLEKIKFSKILDETLKSQLLHFFPKLLTSQKEYLIQTLNKEKELLTNYLKSSKDIEMIKYDFQNVFIENLKLQELKENEAENYEEILSTNLSMQ